MKPLKMFANPSIRVRLSLLIALNSSIALVLAGMGFFGYESYQQRNDETRELSSEAGIIADNSTAALNFSDEKAATDTLAALKGDLRLVEAVIYDANDKPFARYHRTNAAASPDAAVHKEGVYFENGALLVVRPIRFQNERIGTISLEVTNDLGKQLRQYIGIV